MLEDALMYLENGWSVIPLQPKGKIPLFKGWESFSNRLPTENQVTLWWKGQPNANIGLVTGPASGVFALDIDGKDGMSSISGQDLGYTITTKTRNGEHRLYKIQDPAMENRVKFLPGLDIRATGGMVVIPPSIHPSGTPYRWLVGPDQCDPIDPPQWLLTALEESKNAKIDSGTSSWAKTLYGGATTGERNQRLAEIVGHYLRMGMTQDEVLEMALMLNKTKFEPPLPITEVERTVVSISNKHKSKTAPNDGKVEEEYRQDVGDTFGIDVSTMRKYMTDPPTYHMSVNGRDVIFQTVDYILDQRKFRSKIAEVTNILPPLIGKDRWDSVCQSLLNGFQETLGVEEGTNRGWFKSTLERYIYEHRFGFDEAETRSYYIDIQLALSLTHYVQWYKIVYNEKLDLRELVVRLRMWGAKRRDDGDHWLIPTDLHERMAEDEKQSISS